MRTKGKAAAPTTALKNTLQTEDYHSVDDKSRYFLGQSAINMTATILLRLQAGCYTSRQKKGVWPIVDTLVRSHVAGGQNAA